MKKCDCYDEYIKTKPLYNKFTGLVESSYEDKEGHCSGTKECDICNCGGDRLKCDFYDHVKKKAKDEIKEMTEKEELELTRKFISECGLQYELLHYFYKEQNKKD